MNDQPLNSKYSQNEIWSITSVLYDKTPQTRFGLNAGDWKLVPSSFIILSK